jgi:hypothetical protein
VELTEGVEEGVTRGARDWFREEEVIRVGFLEELE